MQSICFTSRIAPFFVGLIIGSMGILLGCNQRNTFLDPLEAGWEGERVCEILEENTTIRVLKCTFPPGVGHERHEHAPHFGYTLKGSKFRITDDQGTRELDVPTGYDFYNEGITLHEVQNIGDSTAVFLIVEPKR